MAKAANPVIRVEEGLLEEHKSHRPLAVHLVGLGVPPETALGMGPRRERNFLDSVGFVASPDVRLYGGRLWIGHSAARYLNRSPELERLVKGSTQPADRVLVVPIESEGDLPGLRPLSYFTKLHGIAEAELVKMVFRPDGRPALVLKVKPKKPSDPPRHYLFNTEFVALRGLLARERESPADRLANPDKAARDAIKAHLTAFLSLARHLNRVRLDGVDPVPIARHLLGNVSPGHARRLLELFEQTPHAREVLHRALRETRNPVPLAAANTFFGNVAEALKLLEAEKVRAVGVVAPEKPTLGTGKPALKAHDAFGIAKFLGQVTLKYPRATEKMHPDALAQIDREMNDAIRTAHSNSGINIVQLRQAANELAGIDVSRPTWDLSGSELRAKDALITLREGLPPQHSRRVDFLIRRFVHVAGRFSTR